MWFAGLRVFPSLVDVDEVFDGFELLVVGDVAEELGGALVQGIDVVDPNGGLHLLVSCFLLCSLHVAYSVSS